MIKKIILITLLIIVNIFIFTITSMAFEDELFEFDLPSSFANMSYQNMYIFADTEANSSKGLIIYAEESTNIKNSVWDIEQDDIDYLVRRLGYTATVIDTDRKAKLGREKAIKITMQDEGTYMEMYLLASNKYVYAVAFVGESQADLNSSDFEMIKDSFKLKDSTTNFKAIFTVVFVIIIVAIILFSSLRKRPKNNINHNIDYKNMTEDDFNLK